MTKESLMAMGLTEEQATKVVGELNGSYVPKTRFNEVNTELQAARNTIKERDTQLTELQKSTGDLEGMKQQIAQLQATNTEQQKKYDTDMRNLKVGNVVDAALRAANAINPATVKPLLADFLEKAVLADDGTVTGLTEEIGKLVKGEGTSFLFRPNVPPAPAISGTSPAGTITATPSPQTTGYEARLAEARKTGNSALVVAIKREAAAEGIQLF